MLKQFIVAVAAVFVSTAAVAQDGVCMPFVLPNSDPIEAEWHIVDSNMSVVNSGTGNFVATGAINNIPDGFTGFLIGAGPNGSDAHIKISGTGCTWNEEQVFNPETGKAENVWTILPHNRVIEYSYGFPAGDADLDIGIDAKTGQIGMNVLNDGAGLFFFINSLTNLDPR